MRQKKIALREISEASPDNIAAMKEGGHGLLATLDGQQASVNTKLHAVYAYFLGFTIARIATVYRKGTSTVSRWIEI